MEKKKSSKLTLTESIILLTTRKKQDDWLQFVSPEGLRYLNLRYDPFGNPERPFKLMFKRSPELKKYYPHIRNWFGENELTWKDITVNHEKYMAAELPPHIHKIGKLVLSVQDEIFGISETHITSPDADLTMKLSGIRAPFIGLFCGFSILICLVSYVLYQVVRLPKLGIPSFDAFTWEEAFMILLIPLCYQCLWWSGYAFEKKKYDKPKWKNPKIILGRIVLLCSVFLGFCTY